MSGAITSVVPAGLRHFARAAHRDFVFSRAMKRFVKDPAACVRPGHPTLLDLLYGWGYDRASGKDVYLAVCIERALKADGAILECGSGLSTILVGAIAGRRGVPHWALEHTPRWAEKVKKHLGRQRLDGVRMSVGDLKDYGDFSWYDPLLDAMPARFTLVLCDGPPGYIKGGRYGLVPIMRERLAPGCVILLDDVDRESDLDAARRWKQELGVPYEIFGGDKPYIEMKMPAMPAPV
jgi:hypothetical protein